MRKVTALLLVVMIIAGQIPTVAQNELPFCDIAGDNHEMVISKMANEGIVQGDGDCKFRPEDYITYAEASSIMNNLYGLTTSDVACKKRQSDFWYDEVMAISNYYALIDCQNDLPNENLDLAIFNEQFKGFLNQTEFLNLLKEEADSKTQVSLSDVSTINVEDNQSTNYVSRSDFLYALDQVTGILLRENMEQGIYVPDFNVTVNNEVSKLSDIEAKNIVISPEIDQLMTLEHINLSASLVYLGTAMNKSILIKDSHAKYINIGPFDSSEDSIFRFENCNAEKVYVNKPVRVSFDSETYIEKLYIDGDVVVESGGNIGEIIVVSGNATINYYPYNLKVYDGATADVKGKIITSENDYPEAEKGEESDEKPSSGGGTTPTPEPDENLEKAKFAIEGYPIGDLTFYPMEDTYNNMTKAVVLPSHGIYGSQIEWAVKNSEDADIWTFQDGYGYVQRPAYDSTSGPGITTTLVATSTVEGASYTKDYTFTVLKTHAPGTSIEENETFAKEVADNIDFQYADGDSQNSVTRNFFFPLTGDYESTISWVSNNPQVVKIASSGYEGEVTRPKYIEDGEDTEVTLTGTVSVGMEPYKVTTDASVTVKVKAQTEEQYAVILLEEALNELTLDDSAPITSDLTLPTLPDEPKYDGVSVNWISSNYSYIRSDGTVTRPTYLYGNQNVTLASEVIYDGKDGNITDIRSYHFVVAVEEDSTALNRIKENLDVTTFLPETDTKDNVTTAVVLPRDDEFLENGGHIDWIMTPNTYEASLTQYYLNVNRPVYGTGDQTFNLIAKLYFDDITDAVTKDYGTYTIKEAPITSEEQDILNVADGKDNLEIILTDDNTSIDAIKYDFYLPRVGSSSTTVTWEVITPDVQSFTVSTFNNELFLCDVTRPSVDSANETVTLRATITSGSASDTKDIDVTIVKSDIYPQGTQVKKEGENWVIAEEGDVGTYTGIWTIEDLQKIGSDGFSGIWGSYADYTIMRDLDFNSADSYRNIDNKVGMTTGEGFEPLNFDGTYFTAIIEGDGHTINNLYINRPDQEKVGLISDTGFSSEETGVKNLTLDHVMIIGGRYTGGLCGYMMEGYITNVHVSGQIQGKNISGALSNDYVGGLVGLNSFDGIISLSSFDGLVEGANRVGGICGEITYYTASIEKCFSDGYVYASDSYAGGLAGSASGTVKYSYSTSYIESENGYTGGLLGDYANETNALTECYATGTVITKSEDTFADTGGLIGYYYPPAEMNSTVVAFNDIIEGRYMGSIAYQGPGIGYYNEDMLFVPTSGTYVIQINGFSLTSEAFKDLSHIGFDSNIWEVKTGAVRPTLKEVTDDNYDVMRSHKMIAEEL